MYNGDSRIADEDVPHIAEHVGNQSSNHGEYGREKEGRGHGTTKGDGSQDAQPDDTEQWLRAFAHSFV